MPDLSVIIPARQEEWLTRTVADVFEHAKADTEVIVILDGAWPDEPLPQHPRLQVVYVPESIGQRAATNLGARLSTARYLMKLDAHCSLADRFDVSLIEAAEALGDDVIQVPAQKNLHVYDWHCGACGRVEYQCGLTECRACGSTRLTREIVWKPKSGVHTKRWRFDSALHFQYWGGEPKGALVETMSCLGACWFVSKAFWVQIEGLDEAHGSWGQVGTELGCKAWLSGGKLITNNRTWFAHFFRVGGQKFPYPMTGMEQEYARQYSQALWRGNRWPGQKYPLRWLVEKFWPVPGWTEEARDALPRMLDRGTARDAAECDDGSDPSRSVVAVRSGTLPTRGLVYYTDNRLDPRIVSAVCGQLSRFGYPLIAVSLQPMSEWVQNLVLPLERGYLTMFQEILAGLEALSTDLVFLVEHDVLYHPSHFEFTPPDRSKVYYNQHVYKVDSHSGRALHYRCSQTSGLCADRHLLVEHYRRRVALVEQRGGYSRAMGFEPGTHGRPERVDDLQAETWMSAYPNIDIRHGQNLTPSRWRKEQFRNQHYTAGWTESDRVPGWGTTLGRFDEFLAEVAHGAVQQAVA